MRQVCGSSTTFDMVQAPNRECLDDIITVNINKDRLFSRITLPMKNGENVDCLELL